MSFVHVEAMIERGKLLVVCAVMDLASACRVVVKEKLHFEGHCGAHRLLLLQLLMFLIILFHLLLLFFDIFLVFGHGRVALGV